MRRHWLARAVMAGAGLAALASAQTFPLQMVGTSNGLIQTIANDSSIGFATAVGQSQILMVTATYAGSGKISITQAPLVPGSTEFTATLSGTLPLTLNPGDSFSFDIVFRPTSANEVSAIFNLPFTETVTAAGSSTPVVTANAINLTLVGTAASFVVSYIKGGNVIQLATGGTMLFDPQPINTTVTLALNITNTGSAPGAVNTISVSGKAF